MELKNEIRKYNSVNKAHLNEVKITFENLNLNEVIEMAAKSIDPTNNYKMFSHQRRIGRKVVNEGYEKLKFREDEFISCDNFEDIMFITDDAISQIPRLGPLWSYDTALRIGFNLKIYPTKVYLQAGVIKGYKKIFNQNSNNRFVNKEIFPQELQILEPYEIENFLCMWGSNLISGC